MALTQEPMHQPDPMSAISLGDPSFLISSSPTRTKLATLSVGGDSSGAPNDINQTRSFGCTVRSPKTKALFLNTTTVCFGSSLPSASTPLTHRTRSPVITRHRLGPSTRSPGCQPLFNFLSIIKHAL